MSDSLTVFLDATRYTMMLVVSESRYMVIDPYTKYSFGGVQMTIEATHPRMTTSFLAWMIEGWLDLVGMYGFWEEMIELRDATLGLLAIGKMERLKD